MIGCSVRFCPGISHCRLKNYKHALGLQVLTSGQRVRQILIGDRRKPRMMKSRKLNKKNQLSCQSERRATLRYALAGVFELLEGLADLLRHAKR